LLQSLAPGERPRALALMSPWCDLTQQGDSLLFNAGRDPTLKPDDLRRCAKAYATHHDRQAAALSPLFGTFDPAMPPAIITTGSRDLLMSDSIRLATVMQQAGMMAELRIGEGLWHVFEFYDIPEAHRSLQRIAGFLRQSIEKA
jgi:acetyl esterase/lipase